MGYLQKIFKQKKRSKKLQNCKKFYYANIVLCLSIVIFIVGYFIQANTMAYKGYIILDAEKQIAELHNKYKQLELEVIELQSLESISGRAENMELVSSDNGEYLSVHNQQVAKR